MGIVIIDTCLLWFNMIHFYMLSIYHNKVLKETSANEKIAFIGSSGGNLFKQGGNDIHGMMKEILLQTGAADMEISAVQYILASSSLDTAGPDSSAKLYTWKNGELYLEKEGTLSQINKAAVSIDEQIAEMIRAGEIDGVMFVSAEPDKINHQSFQAAIDTGLPLAGTGGRFRCESPEYGRKSPLCFRHHRYNKPDQSRGIHHCLCERVEHPVSAGHRKYGSSRGGSFADKHLEADQFPRDHDDKPSGLYRYGSLPCYQSDFCLFFSVRCLRYAGSGHSGGDLRYSSKAGVRPG